MITSTNRVNQQTLVDVNELNKAIWKSALSKAIKDVFCASYFLQGHRQVYRLDRNIQVFINILSEFPSTLKINIGSMKWLAHLITRSGIKCKKKTCKKILFYNLLNLTCL